MSEQLLVETVRQAAARKAWETIRARRAAAGLVTLQKTVQRRSEVRALKEAVKEVSKEVSEAEQERRDESLRKAFLKLQDLRWRQTGQVRSMDQLLGEGLLVGELLEKGDLDQLSKVMAGIGAEQKSRIEVQGVNGVMGTADYMKQFNERFRGSRY